MNPETNKNDIDNIDNIDNIEFIKWAFEKGYRLGVSDLKNCVHIKFSETREYFLDDLCKFYSDKEVDLHPLMD